MRRTGGEKGEMGCRSDGWFSNDGEFIPSSPQQLWNETNEAVCVCCCCCCWFLLGSFLLMMQSKTQSEVRGFSSADTETVFMKSGCTSENTHEAIRAIQSQITEMAASLLITDLRRRAHAGARGPAHIGRCAGGAFIPPTPNPPTPL